jgi:hypothetical protein
VGLRSTFSDPTGSVCTDMWAYRALAIYPPTSYPVELRLPRVNKFDGFCQNLVDSVQIEFKNRMNLLFINLKF